MARQDCYNKFGAQLPRDLFNTIQQADDPVEVLQARLAAMQKQKQQTVLQAIRTHQAEQSMKQHSKGAGPGLLAVMTRDKYGEGVATSVEKRADAILGQAHSRLAEMMSAYRTRTAGLTQDKQGTRNLVRELFGEATGDSNAARFAKDWSDVAEMLRQRFNKAGGDIPKRDDWNLPQFHDPNLVRRADRDEWKAFIRERVDRQKMTNMDTGQPLTDMEFELALDNAYDTISTNGLSDLRSGTMGGKKRANRHQEHRFFVFRDADAWLSYHDKYGRADIYTTLTDHIQGMSHDIALVEAMGPNPEATFRYLKDEARKEYMRQGRPNKHLGYVDAVWNVVSGKTGAAENVAAADFSSGVRHFLVSTRLGAAFLSSLSDVTFQALTRQFNGLPVMRMFAQQLSLMNPANEADRIFATKMGLVADAWLNHSHVANRFVEVSGVNTMAKLSDFTMRASGLSAWTDAGRKAFGMEMASFMADMADVPLRKMKKSGRQKRAFARTLERYGITAKEWDIIRATQPIEHKGIKFLSPAQIAERTDLSQHQANNLAAKVLDMVNTEMDFAVPTPDALGRAISTGGGLKGGSAGGEIARHVMTFKSFPIAVILTHMFRGMYQAQGAGKLAYLSAFFAGTTLLGGMVIQLKEFSKGREQRPMDDARFWNAAMMQGGGAGIFGDFLFSETSRFGNSLISTMAGPTAGFVQDLAQYPLANITDMVTGKETHFASDAVRLARRNAPGPFSLWYTRLAVERSIFDQLDLLADKPKARKSFRRMEKRWRKEFGQKYYWRPGELTPE